MRLSEWKERAERGTSGEMVYDILADWQRETEVQQQEIIGWRERYEELDAGHSKLYKDFCKMKPDKIFSGNVKLIRNLPKRPRKEADYYNPADGIIIKESTEYDKILDEALEQLKQNNKNLADAAIEKPPYKVELLEALKLARDLIYNNMPYPANTPKYDEYLQVLRALEKAIGGANE